MNIKKLILLPAMLFALCSPAFADGIEGDPEVVYKYQFGADFQVKLMKGLKLNIEPEFRFCEGYDKFNLNGGLSYKTFGCLYFGAAYRIIIDRVESESSSTNNMMYSGFGANNYDSEYYHRYAFDVTYKEKFGRFTPSFRLQYSNYTDDEVDDKEYLRYRAKVEYDIKKCKITPFVAAEAFQELDENLLYKMRYVTGFDLKTGKQSSLSFAYKFEYFTLKYKNTNIFSLGYKYKF
ncbi:MAG: DUF2490 domain-containing protein [Rikenellaceae bacterium]